ncbi:MAG: hypothetical protein ACR2NU_04415, partial [Aeoliella sp.]
MDLDPDNYRMITVEPVEPPKSPDDASLAALPNAKTQHQQPVAEPRSGVDKLKEERLTESSRENKLAGGMESKAGELQPVEDEAEASEFQHAGWARRLARPSSWYYFNSPPQEEGEAYRLRGQPEANARKKVKLARGLGELQKEMDNLSRTPQGETATVERFSKVDALRQQQQALQVQVLFVLRNSELPAKPPAAESAAAREAEGAP